MVEAEIAQRLRYYMKSLFPVGLAAAFFSITQIEAQEYLGANQAIEKITALENSEDTKKPDSLKRLSEDINDYNSRKSSLTPEEAGTKWLSLVDRYLKLSQNSYRDGENSRLSFENLVAALPAPASWPHIEKTLANQKPDGSAGQVSLNTLKWFVHTLLGDIPAQQNDYRAIVDYIGSLPPEAQVYYESIPDRLTEQMIASSSDPEFILRALNEQLDRSIAGEAKRKSLYGSGYTTGFSLPDLVAIVGSEKAEPLIKKALTTFPGPISIRGEKTSDLARQIANANPDALAAAQWQLACAFDSEALYQSMQKRSGTTSDDYQVMEAKLYELSRLILAGDQKAALKFQESLPSESLNSLPSDLLSHAEKTGKTAIVLSFFDTALRQDPTLPYWETYFEAANADKQPEKAIELMKEALSRPGLNAKTQQSLGSDLSKALLSVGRVDEGVAELLKMAKQPPSKEPGEDNNKGALALEIVELGVLANRTQWIQEGLDIATKEVESDRQNTRGYGSPLSSANSLAKVLLQMKQGPQAEALLIESLGQEAQRDRESSRDYISTSDRNNAMATLAGIYSEAGMNSDIVTLLDRAPFWCATDLSQVMSLRVPNSTRQSDYLGDVAARALEAGGDKETALRIIQAQLARNDGDDRAYELLLRHAGASALPILDALAAQDRYEERPLIWKAQWLFNEGKLPEAEETIRTAIAIDPSDGEQGPGDRMRAYSVLADIRAARGDAKEAEFFRGVVKAIRLSEQADVLYSAGLEKQAIGLYETSLGMFADAYCIQSRLALRMNELGDWKGAEEHYRKAYELMPDSFGQVESHCFGCEGAFNGKKPQGVADKVFTTLAEKKPDNPKVHYLLGYLRKEQGRSGEALAEFKKATSLDPNYLNAWKKMAELSDELLLPASERNAIALNIARLDPFAKHASLDLNGVTNYAEIWTILSAADKRRLPRPTDLYPLKAAAKEIESLKDDPAKDRLRQQILSSINSDYSRDKPSTAQFAKAPFVGITSQILTTTANVQSR